MYQEQAQQINANPPLHPGQSGVTEEVLVDDGLYLDPEGDALEGRRLRGRLDRFDESDVESWHKIRETWPCPVCEDDGDECRISPAGTYVACANKYRGWGVVSDAGDLPYAGLHVVASRVGPQLDGDRLLLAKNLAELRASGLTDETIRRAGLYSEADPEAIRQLLGWKKLPTTLGPVLMIPYRDAQGSDTGNIRLKPDKPLVNDDGRERKYEAPKLRPSRAYFPPGTITALADPTAPLLVTEGEKKALKAEQEGFPCVGLSGVWNWVKKQVEVEPAAGPRQRHLIDDLAAVPWKGRPVYIVFDSDAARNENVREAQFALAVQLMERGAVVKIVNLPDGPEGDDGEPTKVGLDDYLVAHPADDLRKLIEGATDPEEIEPREGRPVETFKDPHRLAAGFLKSRKQHPIRPGVHFWDDQWWYWNGKVYAPVPASLVNADVTKFVKQEFDRKNVEDVKRWRAARRAYEAKAAADKAAGRTTGSASPGELPPAVAPVTTGVVNNTIQAARAITHLDPSLRPPVWVESPDRPPAGEMLAFDNGLPHWPSYLEGKMGAFVPHTPAFFGQTLADFPFDPAAPPPAAWLEFLGQLWPSDPDSVATLQEVFGYLLTDDTSRQKIIGVIGPRRSGKGTIARVLTALLGGDQAVASVTLAGLSNEFGLAPLLDKRLAIIPDARVSREADMAVMAERLLSISGEDAQTVNRKNKDHILGRLRVRFLFMSNEVPQLLDTSGALPGRFLLLKLTESWYGREDVNLLPRLLAELPGILLWSLDGLRRLRARGHFVQPTRATDLVEQMEELASPLGAFVRERCLVSPDQFVFAEDLRAAWHAWAKEKGYANYEWTPGVFGRNIRSVVPTADREQRRHPQTSKAVGAYVGLGLKPAA